MAGVILLRQDEEIMHLSAKTEANARAKMLIYLIENKLVSLP